jgi:lysyl-tRNA synthetase class 2
MPVMPSSVVRAIKYNAPSHTLRVIYVSGNIYDYMAVPENVYEKMRTAVSKGEFLNTRIKGHYSFQKIK